jgi:hypothetical protein
MPHGPRPARSADLAAHTTMLHWAGKQRGPGFEPIGFELREHPHPTWTYHDGRPVQMAVAVPSSMLARSRIAVVSASEHGWSMGVLLPEIGWQANVLLVLGAGVIFVAAILLGLWCGRVWGRRPGSRR